MVGRARRVAGAAIVLAALSAASAKPPFRSYSPSKGNSSTPLGTRLREHPDQLRLYSAATGGRPCGPKRRRSRSMTASSRPFSVRTPRFRHRVHGASVYLGVTVGTDAEMAPRQQIVSVPYAVGCRERERRHHAHERDDQRRRGHRRHREMVGPPTGSWARPERTGPSGATGSNGATGPRAGVGSHGSERRDRAGGATGQRSNGRGGSDRGQLVHLAAWARTGQRRDWQPGATGAEAAQGANRCCWSDGRESARRAESAHGRSPVRRRSRRDGPSRRDGRSRSDRGWAQRRL